ncbi:MAG: hypothetical protein AAFQ89_09915 [Cyanobacteria bacterium J06626_18]
MLSQTPLSGQIRIDGAYLTTARDTSIVIDAGYFSLTAEEHYGEGLFQLLP